jgi:uncharacterized membrane protein
MYWQGLLNYSRKQERKNKMKDLLNTVMDMTLMVLLFVMAAYAMICFAVYYIAL